MKRLVPASFQRLPSHLFTCGCPRRLVYATVDSYIGKLQYILSDAGRQGEWKRTLLLGNPAAENVVKLYLKQVTAEQLQARILSKQAVPLFPDKLLLLSNHLEKRLTLPNLSATERFITARDQAFFKTLFYSGYRAGDLGQLKTVEIARFPDDSGSLFNDVWGKMSSLLSRSLFIVQSECVVQNQARLCKFRVVALRFTHRYQKILVEFSLNF